jgi:hypothetical protein
MPGANEAKNPITAGAIAPVEPLVPLRMSQRAGGFGLGFSRFIAVFAHQMMNPRDSTPDDLLAKSTVAKSESRAKRRAQGRN